MSSADRAITVYPSRHEPVAYEPGGTWLAVAVLVTLFVVSFGLIALWFLFWR